MRSQALATFTVSRVRDINGIEVEFERLLLPFSGASGVERIIASLNTISVEGAFEIKNLMRNNESLPVYEVLAVIDQKLIHSQADRKAVADLDLG
jgi:hypothetical protein